MTAPLKSQADKFSLVKQDMNFMKNCNSVTFYFMKNSFSDISRKWILRNMIGAVINFFRYGAVAALIIFGKMHFLLIPEKKIGEEVINGNAFEGMV